MNTMNCPRQTMLKQRLFGFQALIVCWVAYGIVLTFLDQSPAWLGSATAQRAVHCAASASPNRVSACGSSLTIAAAMKHDANVSSTWLRYIGSAVLASACIMHVWSRKQPKRLHARHSERAVVALHVLQSHSETQLQTCVAVPPSSTQAFHEPEPVHEHNLLGLVREPNLLQELNLLGFDHSEMSEQACQSNHRKPHLSGTYGQQRKQKRTPRAFASRQRERRRFGARLGSRPQYEPRVESYDPSRVWVKLQCGLQIHCSPNIGGSSKSSAFADAEGPMSVMDSSQVFSINRMEATKVSKASIMHQHK